MTFCSAWTIAGLSYRVLDESLRLREQQESVIASSLYLSRFAVHAGEQQPGGLPHVVAVHGEASPMLGVGDRHPDPLHQRRQHQERPAGGSKGFKKCHFTRTIAAVQAPRNIHFNAFLMGSIMNTHFLPHFEHFGLFHMKDSIFFSELLSLG